MSSKFRAIPRRGGADFDISVLICPGIAQYRAKILKIVKFENHRCDYWHRVASRPNLGEDIKFHILSTVHKIETLVPMVRNTLNRIDEIDAKCVRKSYSIGEINIRLTDLQCLLEVYQMYIKKIESEFKETKKKLQRAKIPLEPEEGDGIYFRL